MITADFTGNIGDHLKIYALVRTIAEKNGYEWGFNPTPSHDYYNGAEQMDFLKIDYGKIHNAPWGVLPEGIVNVVEEKKERIVRPETSYDFYPYMPELFDIEDNTKIIVNCAQNFRYYDGKKEEIRNWFKIREEKEKEFEEILEKNHIVLDENTCVLNARGGEYLAVRDFSLKRIYWQHAYEAIMKINKNMKFICVTDDVNYYKEWFPFPVVHFSIGCDYYILNHAKNLIISNSAFAMFPVWLNKNNPFVIAPKYWARHNTSNGYWGYAKINIPDWNWMDKEGNFENI
jgi:hypothetical protein